MLRDILKTIRNISLRLDALEKHTLVSLDLSAKQSMIILTIDRDLSFTHTHIAAQTGISKSTLTGALQSLERKGLIERIKSKQDRRKTYVNLTSQGKILRAVLCSDDAEHGASAAAIMTELEKKLLYILLKKFSNHLGSTL